MAKPIDADNGSRFIQNGEEIGMLAETVAATPALGLSLDRLAAIQRTRNEALAGRDARARQNAQAALRRWKKRRGWKTLLSARKRGTRWMQTS